MRSAILRRSAIVTTLGLALLAFACDSTDTAGEGELVLELNGGQAVATGFPYEEGGSLSHGGGTAQVGFVDGWETLRFTKYLIVAGNVRVREHQDQGAKGKVLAGWEGSRVFDLAAAGGQAQELVQLREIAAGRVDVELDVLPATAATEAGAVAAVDVERMRAGGWSYLLEGVAQRGDEQVRFELGLSAGGHYYDCNNGKENPPKNGLVVESEKTTSAFVYSHAVHLFWDTLASGDEDLRFDPFAQAAGGDGVVTMDDLAAFSLIDLTLPDGDFYNDGGYLSHALIERSCSTEDPCLAAFAVLAMRQSIHFNGVGFCPFTAIDP